MSRLFAFATALVVSAPCFAQAPPAAPGPARSGRQAALEDITGYWVSLVTEDWRYRMVTPAKGDVGSIPVTPEGRKAAEAWDPAKDEAAGDQCKAYGAPGLMRRPTRLHITWQDDNILKVETDEGTQTRFFHFGAEAPTKQAPSLQGHSLATWDSNAPPAGRGGRGGGPPPGPGSLKVVTTDLKQGYLHKNGVPYGEKTVLTEYFTKANDSDGTSWLILTADVEDGGQYIRGDFLTSTHYLKEPDGSKWDPSPCSAR